MPSPVRYLAGLNAGRTVLWCYLIWYLVVLVRYFDPSPALWLTSVGLAGIIGLALYMNVARSGLKRVTLEFWPTVRLFLTPLCVSSFAALVKGKSFVLVFSPRWEENAIGVGLCAAFVVVVYATKAIARRSQ
ncbi:MAG TPA: hypothetical protein VEA69_07700 [Tepidisphaeraceae bacterium]|nr:hypothetical protein [Tepidisphaeraceae bacterium]